MPNQFLGFNQYADSTGISEEEAGEAVNCFFHDRVRGLLGQRKGRTWQRTGAYKEEVTGRGRFVLPSGTERAVIAQGNGDSVEEGSNPTGNYTLYITGDTATGKAMTPSSLTLTYPATSAEVNAVFDDSSTYEPSNSSFISWANGFATVGVTDWDEVKKFRISYGINENGTPKFLHNFEFTTNISSGVLSLSGTPQVAAHSGIDTIIGACFRISWPDGWPTGAGAGDSISLSTLLAG